MFNTVKGIPVVFVAPSRAFGAIRDDRPVLVPMLILVASALVVAALYWERVDPEFLADELIANTVATNVERGERVRRGLTVLGKQPTLIPIVAGAGLDVVFTLFAFSVYLWAVGKITGDGGSSRASLSLASWAFLPTVIGSVAGVAMVLSADQGRIAIATMFPLNAVWLLGLDHRSLSWPIRAFDLTHLWVVVLVAIGYRSWYGGSLMRAVLIASLPFAAFFGLGLILLAI